VALSADGGRVVSGSYDGTVRVWDALSGECVRELRGHTNWVLSVALSADGGRVVSGSDDGTVRVWDALSGECVCELRGHTDWVRSVALSADGGRVVSGSDDVTVRVWDALSGECVRELRGHTNWVRSVALSAEGGRVVSGSDDGTVRCFSGMGGRAETLACTWIAAVGSPDDIPSYASWRPGAHAANAEGPSGAMSSSQTKSKAGKQQTLGPEGPPTTAVGDSGLPTDAGDVLISASGDAWRFLSWDVEDPNEPSGWRRVPLQAYE
ncbi:MAG: WD40 repeat domain-containing protein, partial [Xanthomonadaceae bacterium]|nr:WD40 repeat domain-containing protein [Xanthomonadaceae bacterium]